MNFFKNKLKNYFSHIKIKNEMNTSIKKYFSEQELKIMRINIINKCN